MSNPIYRRAVPDPLPIEPYLQKIPGSEAFLRAIAEEPLEDVHRLALADWLEEQGHTPRATFIRLQCQREQVKRLHPASNAIDHQIEQLFRQHARDWLVGLARIPRFTWRRVANFRRGLLEGAELHSALSWKGYHSLFGAVDVRGLHLSRVCDDVELQRLLELPSLSQLLSLSLWDYWLSPSPGADNLRALACAPDLAGLVEFSLSTFAAEESLVALCEAMQFPRLNSLTLVGRGLQEEAMRALGRCAGLGNLRELHLFEAPIDHPEMTALANAPLLDNVELLRLGDDRLTTRAIAALVGSPRLARLQSLALGPVFPLATEAVKVLAGSSLLSRLSALALESVDLRPAGFKALTRSACTRNLRILTLTQNHGLGDDGIRLLVESRHLTKLEALDLAGVSLTRRGAELLAGSPLLSSLTALSLRGNTIGPAAQALAASPYLNKLSFLDLRRNDIPPRAKASLRDRWPFVLL